MTELVLGIVLGYIASPYIKAAKEILDEKIGKYKNTKEKIV
jgi:hypothetical protein